MAALNTQTSIVDYLKSVGQDSSYGNRANIYASSGLNLGNYQGTAQQNVALLQYLQGGGGQPTSNNVSTQPTSAPTSASPAPSSSATPRVDYVEQLSKQLQESDAKYAAQTKQAQQSLIDYYANLENPIDRFDRLRSEQGVDQQRELVNALTGQVLNVEDILRNIEPTTNERTGRFLMTDSDRQAMIARESQPHQKNMIDLLRQKEREEIGLAGSESLVRELFQIAQLADEQGARPLQLGVDYSVAERQTAMDLLSSIMGQKVTAFSGDQSAAESRQAADLNWQREQEMEQIRHQNRTQLEQLSHNLQLTRTMHAQAKTQAEKEAAQKTETAWNQIIAGATTEYDVWKAIDQRQSQLRSQGVDVDELWRMHAALAAETGQGQAFRKPAASSKQDELVEQLKQVQLNLQLQNSSAALR